MSRLPAELLPFIISQVHENHLPACSLVNKAFYSATVPILWRSYREKVHSINASPLHLIRCLQNPNHPMTTFLKCLSLDKAWNDTYLLQLLPHLERLQDLEIADGINIKVATLQQLPSHCPQLKALRLGFFKLTSAFMGAFGHHCQQLEKLDLWFCSDLSSTTTSLFAPLLLLRNGFSLKKLWISNGYNGRCYWKEQTIIDMLQLPDLTDVRFQDGTIDLVQRILSTTTTTTTVWPQLTVLSIDSLGDTGDDLLIPFLQLYPHLRSVSFPGSQLTDATLDTLATCLSTLTHLDVKFTMGITVAGVRRLIHRCPRLTFIQLFGCNSAFSAMAFPEADDCCLAHHQKNEDGHYLVCYLDQQATDTIRLGTSLQQP